MTKMRPLGMAFAATAVAALLLHPQAAAAQPLSAQDAADLRAQLAALKAQVERLEARLDAAQGTAAANIPVSPVSSPPAPVLAAAPPARPDTRIAWKGAPQFTLGDASFKVRGRIQLDAAYVAAPGSVKDRALGFSSEVRRVRLGAEGMLSGRFGYKLETELSDNILELVDTYITYDTGKLLLTLGNQNQFQSLDELVNDNSGSVMERAAFTDAFGFERRLGLAAQYKFGAWIAQGGIFSDSIDSLANSNDGPKGGDENNSFALDGRLVFAPTLGHAQLHFGGSYHWRNFNRLSENPVRYSQRPFVHSVNSRFLSTPAFSADGETHYGVEAAAIIGRVHVAGEGHWLRVSRPGLADPTFFGAYGEVGYFLTKGDRRNYSNGALGSFTPAQPVGMGGIGAIQVNLRYDYLDMNDAGIIGGTQNAYIASLIWSPVNLLRFNLNYSHIDYTDAAILAGTRADYGIDVVSMRAELDF